MNSGYPGNGEYPINYRPCHVIVQSRGREKEKRSGVAYWSGFRWMGLREFRIGKGKVIKWTYEE